MGPPGRWWDDPEFVKKLGLSDDQQKKMDDIFNTNRLKLIDLFGNAAKRGSHHGAAGRRRSAR